MSALRYAPRDSSGRWVVYEINSTGLLEWVDYIPIQSVTEVPASEDRFEDDGYIEVDTLASVTGLTEWEDYIPVDFVTSRTARWRTDTNQGFIPVVDKTP